MVTLRSLSAMAVLALSFAPAWALDVGNWSIAYYPKSGTRAGCSMTGSYKNGIVLSLVVNTQYQWGVLLSDSNWKLSPSATTDVAAFVDGRFIASGKASHLNENAAYLPFEGGAAFKALREGNLLELKLQTGSLSFALPDTNKAMIATLDCVKSLETRNDAVAKKSTPPADDFRLYTQAESVALLTNLLNTAGVAGYTISPPSSKFRGAEYTAVDGSRGYLVAASGNTKTADDFAGYMTESLSKDCKGQFLLGKEAVPSTDGSVVRKITTTCRDGADAQVSELTIIRKPNGFLLSIGTYANALTSLNQVAPSGKDRTNLVNAAMTWTSRP